MFEYTKMGCNFSLEIAYEHCLTYQLFSDVAPTVEATDVASSGTVVCTQYYYIRCSLYNQPLKSMRVIVTSF